MRRSKGFGFSQSPIQGFSLSLGQAAASTVSAGGEPDLNRALAPLSRDEVSDYSGWGVPEKTLFMLGYQYVAVATAKNLERPDGSPFRGFLPEGMSTALVMLGAAANYANDLGSLSGTLDDLSRILKDTNDKTEANAQAVVKKYRLLRDRVAWEMANAGVTVQYDIVGDDPANPGVVYQRTIGENRVPDLDAVFSQKTPAQMYQAARDLEKRYADLGVSFEHSKLGAAGALPILAILIAIIVGILMFFYLFWNHQDRAKLVETEVGLINGDPTLTPQQKADKIAAIRASESWWGQIFGTFPWTTLVITAGVALIAFFAIPPLLARKVRP